MALTISDVKRFGLGPELSCRVATVTPDSAWADNGESFTPDMVGLQTISAVFCPTIQDLDSDTSVAYIAAWDSVDSVLKLYNSGTTDAGFNEASADDLSAYPFQVLVFGTGN